MDYAAHDTTVSFIAFVCVVESIAESKSPVIAVHAALSEHAKQISRLTTKHKEKLIWHREQVFNP